MLMIFIWKVSWESDVIKLRIMQIAQSKTVQIILTK